MSEQEVLKTDDAMKLLGLSRVELWRRRKSGELGFCKIGTKIRYLRSDIDKFLLEHRAESVIQSDRPARAKR